MISRVSNLFFSKNGKIFMTSFLRASSYKQKQNFENCWKNANWSLTKHIQCSSQILQWWRKSRSCSPLTAATFNSRNPSSSPPLVVMCSFATKSSTHISRISLPGDHLLPPPRLNQSEEVLNNVFFLMIGWF